MSRTLTDSEARWEAVCFIDAAAHAFMNAGAVTRDGWTEDDKLAVEQHIVDRVNGLLRRPRKGATDGG